MRRFVQIFQRKSHSYSTHGRKHQSDDLRKQKIKKIPGRTLSYVELER